MQKLLVNGGQATNVDAEHLQQCVLDLRQGCEIAQIDGAEFEALHCFGHHPAYQVAQDQMSVDLLDNTGGRVRTEVLDVETMFPFTIDGFDLPTAVVEVDEFTVEMNLRIEQRGKQPTGAEARPLVAKQACGKNPGQVGILASGSGGGVEFNDPFILPEAPRLLGVASLLIGEPEEEMRPTERNTPYGCVGEKSRGPSGPSRWSEDGGSGA